MRALWERSPDRECYRRPRPLLQWGERPDASPLRQTRCASEAVPITVESRLVSMATILSNRFGEWLDKRIPPSSNITLTQRNIFIFPSKVGFAFSALLVLMVLLAINYQSSLVYAIAFLLGSMFLITILYTFRNLSGLVLEVHSVRPGFVGEDIEFAIRVVRPQGRGREGVQLGWPGGIPQWAEIYSREADAVSLYVRGTVRGWLNPGRLLVETFYPLGLLRAWTWVDLDVRALVYPQPLFQELPSAGFGRRDEGVLVDPRGSEDFTDIKAYTPGDPIKQVIWRSYAKSGGRDLVVKRYSSYVEPRLWLRFDELPFDVEHRLRCLTGYALQATRAAREFGLELPAQRIEPGIGEAHLEHVLRTLALYVHE